MEIWNTWLRRGWRARFLQPGEKKAKGGSNCSLLSPERQLRRRWSQLLLRGTQWKDKRQWVYVAAREILARYKEKQLVLEICTALKKAPERMGNFKPWICSPLTFTKPCGVSSSFEVSHAVSRGEKQRFPEAPSTLNYTTILSYTAL